MRFLDRPLGVCLCRALARCHRFLRAMTMAGEVVIASPSTMRCVPIGAFPTES